MIPVVKKESDTLHAVTHIRTNTHAHAQTHAHVDTDTQTQTHTLTIDIGYTQGTTGRDFRTNILTIHICGMIVK